MVSGSRNVATFGGGKYDVVGRMCRGFQIADYAGGYASDQHMWRDILRDDRACSDHCALADRHAGQNDHACREPAAISNRDRSWADRSRAVIFHIHVMVGRDEHHVMPERYALAESNHSGRVHPDVTVELAVHADMQVIEDVAVAAEIEWSIQHRAPPN